MKPTAVALLCLSLLMGATLDARSETVSLTPVADAVIYSTKPGDISNTPTGPVSSCTRASGIGPAGGNRVLRSLLRFDLSTHIPPGATVTQAVLRVTKDTQRSTGILRLHRMTSAWSEGATDPPPAKASV